MEKVCSCCKLSKPLSSYYKRPERSSGVRAKCISCEKALKASKKDELLRYYKVYYSNPDVRKKRAELDRGYKEKNRDRINELARIRYAKNPEKHRAKANKNRNLVLQKFDRANRRAHELMARPKWLSKDQLHQIEQFYKSASARSLFHEIKFHVDHIEPLRGKNSCGLHVPWNLQVITASENLSKGNKLFN